MMTAEEFARERGWRVARRPFSLVELALGWRYDQPDYRSREGDGWFGPITRDVFANAEWFTRHGASRNHPLPAGIVAHLSDWPARRAEAEAIAPRFGLRVVEAIGIESWREPGATVVLYTSRRLPE